MVIWTLAKKDLRLLLRDRRALVILLAMPFLFILVLGLSLGEGFGQKPDDRLRISIVDLDLGNFTPSGGYPKEKWSLVVKRDLEQAAGIRLEEIDSREEAERLVRTGKRSAVLIFHPDFSEKVSYCSFLSEPKSINPLNRDGINFKTIDVEVLRDPTQGTAASIIEQVAQVTMLRVVLPWMIGRAFEKIGEVEFIDKLGPNVEVPLPEMTILGRKTSLGSMRLDSLLTSQKQKQAVGAGVQKALQQQFDKYTLTGKTWKELTQPKSKPGVEEPIMEPAGGPPLARGDLRYQILVPSNTVMFAFFLVLTVGWLFVSERREGTLKRLRAAPISRTQILCGKMVPCFLLSLAQGFFLLVAGKLVFNMNWGSEPLWLIPLVFTTSLAAMGMSLLVASLARTETQVAIYGTLLVLVLAGISGCMMPRDLMPEQMKQLSRIAPHAWALDAYAQLLTSSEPNLAVVAQSCLALTAFGACFVALAWWFLKLE